MMADTDRQQETDGRRPSWTQISKKAEWAKELSTKDQGRYEEWLRGIKTMRAGGDCGQVEPWSPYSVRETFYEGWADGDFGTLLSQLGVRDDEWADRATKRQEGPVAR